MPTAAPHACAAPGCSALVPRGRARCEAHERQQRQARGTAAQQGYSSRWRRARLEYLKRNPLCVRCLAEGRVTPARVVDHIRPHKGDEALFWAEGNWQALCDWTSPWDCHGKKTATEDGGFGRPQVRGGEGG